MVKLPTKTSWIDDLIDSLEDAEKAAKYLSFALEENFQTYQLLPNALQDIIESRSQRNNLSEEAQQHYEKLQKLFLTENAVAIYKLIDLLDALGFQLTVSLKQQRS
ncbi:hypothetical protein STA3757_26680 [Stanieria sp. NIES-3757]|nr:hypothetical protein STA3757_26680 [Stanieria sp. NIES-3757]